MNAKRPFKIMNRVLLILCVSALASGCATQPTVVWTKAGVTEQEQAMDEQICTAAGYQAAGPRPQQQAAPSCSGGFSCGFTQGQVAASNGLAMGNWKAAFQSGFNACMYNKGYLQSTINR